MNTKRNLKIAAKSVIYQRREYICFFIALMIVQIFFGSAIISFKNNKKIENKFVNDNYDYHLILKNLSKDQFYFLMNEEYNYIERNGLCDIVKYDTRAVQSTGEKRYDLYLLFRKNIIQNYNTFKNSYIETLSSDDFARNSKFQAVESPLLQTKNNSIKDAGEYTAIILLISALSFGLLMVLYNIRINHFKFTYSIYLTFGADFKKLLSSAFWEMFIVAVITLLPSALLSYIITGIIYVSDKQVFGFYPISIILMLVLSLIVSLLAVIIPIKFLSRKQPMKLIIAEDNSNLVASPRRSFPILRKKFPRTIELYTIFRFRKYFMKLLLSAVCFAVLFVCGVYLAQNYEKRTAGAGSEYTLSFSDGTNCEEVTDKLKGVEGIKYIVKETSCNAMEINSHILVPTNRVESVNDYATYMPNKDWVGNMLVSYAPCDADTLSLFDSYYKYEYTGDPSLVLKDDSYVIISDSISNYKSLSILPGDKIMIAISAYEQPNYKSSDVILKGNEMLTECFSAYKYTYREFTVAAVIKNMSSWDEMKVFTSNSSYETITGKSSEYKNAEVYLNDGITEDNIKNVESSLQLNSDNYGYGINYNFGIAYDQISQAKNQYGIYLIFSCLLFIVTPLIWFFSQILYYSKREEEFKMLHAMGAVKKEIRGIFLTDSIILSTTAGLLFYGMCELSISLLCRLLNWKWLYYIFIPNSINHVFRYNAEIPVTAFFVGLVVTVALGFFVPFISYRLFRRKETDHITEEFSLDE